MNKKGFTLIELVTTFALATVIIILLLNIVSLIKNIYVKYDIKSNLVIEQSNLSKIINEQFNNKLANYTSCNDSEFCYSFTFKDNSEVKLIVKENLIRFGNYTYKLPNNTVVDNPSITREYVDLEDVSNTNNFLNLKIPIKTKKYPKLDFGIDLVYQDKGEVVYEEPTQICTLQEDVGDTGISKGDKYLCKADPSRESYTFFVLSYNDEDNNITENIEEAVSVNLIMDSNIRTGGEPVKETNPTGSQKGTVAWDLGYAEASFPVTAMDYLYDVTNNWTNIPNIAINYTDIDDFFLSDGTYLRIKTEGNLTKIFRADGNTVQVLDNTKEGYTNLKARMPYLSEVSNYDETNGYLYNYLHNWPKQVSEVYGYWTLSSYYGTIGEGWRAYAQVVEYDGNINSHLSNTSHRYGVRPVITLPTTELPTASS